MIVSSESGEPILQKQLEESTTGDVLSSGIIMVSPEARNALEKAGGATLGSFSTLSQPSTKPDKIVCENSNSFPPIPALAPEVDDEIRRNDLLLNEKNNLSMSNIKEGYFDHSGNESCSDAQSRVGSELLHDVSGMVTNLNVVYEHEQVDSTSTGDLYNGKSNIEKSFYNDEFGSKDSGLSLSTLNLAKCEDQKRLGKDEDDDDDGEFFDAVSTPSPFKQSEFDAIDKIPDKEKNVEISGEAKICDKKSSTDHNNDDLQMQGFSEECLDEKKNECIVKNKTDIEDGDLKRKETEKETCDKEENSSGNSKGKQKKKKKKKKGKKDAKSKLQNPTVAECKEEETNDLQSSNSVELTQNSNLQQSSEEIKTDKVEDTEKTIDEHTVNIEKVDIVQSDENLSNIADENNHDVHELTQNSNLQQSSEEIKTEEFIKVEDTDKTIDEHTVIFETVDIVESDNNLLKVADKNDHDVQEEEKLTGKELSDNFDQTENVVQETITVDMDAASDENIVEIVEIIEIPFENQNEFVDKDLCITDRRDISTIESKDNENETTESKELTEIVQNESLDEVDQEFSALKPITTDLDLDNDEHKSEDLDRCIDNQNMYLEERLESRNSISDPEAIGLDEPFKKIDGNKESEQLELLMDANSETAIRANTAELIEKSVASSVIKTDDYEEEKNADHCESQIFNSDSTQFLGVDSEGIHIANSDFIKQFSAKLEEDEIASCNTIEDGNSSQQKCIDKDLKAMAQQLLSDLQTTFKIDQSTVNPVELEVNKDSAFSYQVDDCQSDKSDKNLVNRISMGSISEESEETTGEISEEMNEDYDLGDIDSILLEDPIAEAIHEECKSDQAQGYTEKTPEVDIKRYGSEEKMSKLSTKSKSSSGSSKSLEQMTSDTEEERKADKKKKPKRKLSFLRKVFK